MSNESPSRNGGHMIADKATEGEKHAAFEWLRCIATDNYRTPAVRRLAGVALDEWHACKEAAKPSETRATVGEGPIHRVTYALSDIERWKANSARYEWLADKVIAPDYGDNDSKPRRKGYYIEHCKGTDKIYGESLDAAIDEMIALDAKYAANRHRVTDSGEPK